MGTSVGPAVVTGGARGLGYSIATAFAESGADIALLDILPEVGESAERIAAEYGVRAIGLVVDVTSQAAVDEAYTRVTERLGVPRTLMAAAGICIWNDSLEVTEAEWRKVMGVNLDGVFFAAQSFGRRLVQAGLGGSAILMASMSGSIVNLPQFQASYNASKAGVAHLAKSLAVEWAPKNIRVNSVSPGYFLSDMTKQFTESNPELAADWNSRTPMGRMGQPGDLHGLVTFLASDASSYLTGQDIGIDGGYTAV